MPTDQKSIDTQRRAALFAQFLQLLLILSFILSWGISFAQTGNRVVRIGVYENAPKVFTAENGKPSGIFIDIIEHIAKKEGWDLRYVSGTWVEGLDRVEKGEIDLMPDVAYTAERAKIYSFHKVPVQSSWYQVYAPKGSAIHSILNLNNKRILVLERSVQQQAFALLSKGFGLNITLIPEPDYKTMFEKVARGDADAAITNRFYGMRHAKKFGLEDTAVIFEPSDLFFAAPKNANRQLLDVIDSHLEVLKKDTKSVYYTSLKRWSSEEIQFNLPVWLQFTGLAAAIILLMSLLGSVVLKHQINLRTQELRKSEKNYRDIFENAVMGIYRSTPEGKFEQVNSAFAELFGYSTSEELIANIHDIQKEVYVNPEERLRFRKLFAEKGVVRRFQAEFKRRDGSHFWISISGKAIRDEEGKIQYYEGTVEDITQQKQAEAELQKYREHLETLVFERTEKLEQTNEKLLLEIDERNRTEKALIKSETMYRDLVESANSVILRWTSEGTITFINKFAQQFFGYTRDEIVGKNVVGTIVPETETSGRDLSLLIEDVARNTAAYERSVNENIKKNGQRVWVAWTNKPLMNENAQVAEILSIGNDITRLVETERELTVAKERAESADRLKSAFLATMSHELRTPLNSIIGFTGILKQRLAGPINDEQEKQLNMVYDSAKHLLELINDVLDISKIEAGQLNVAQEAFNLRDSVEKVIKSSQPLADKKGIELSASIDTAIGLIISDRRRVEQILLNLISNAVKFTEEGFVRMNCEVNENKIIIAVKDSGIGIKQEDMGILFNAFQQIESGITRRYDGTGLGLSICKKLAHLLGGEIQVRSEWGVGSVFSLTLPNN